MVSVTYTCHWGMACVSTQRMGYCSWQVLCPTPAHPPQVTPAVTMAAAVPEPPWQSLFPTGRCSSFSPANEERKSGRSLSLLVSFLKHKQRFSMISQCHSQIPHQCGSSTPPRETGPKVLRTETPAPTVGVPHTTHSSVGQWIGHESGHI